MKDKLLKILPQKGFNLNDEQINKLVLFASFLREWNNKMNLTSLEREEDIIYKHFIDSLFCLKVNLPWEGKKIIDIGTGAGFPGIPLKIVLNNSIDLTLCDSLQKRITFLEFVLSKLNLEKVVCVHGRAEDLGKNNLYRENYDLVLARAVARLPVLLELCLPFVKIGGYFMALKGPEGLNELNESNLALNLLGGEVYKMDKFSLQDEKINRIIITIKKVKPTLDKYPRKAGIPSKKPLLS
ncbi:MAG: rRNA (guanine527-N7)-methyltransferase [Clostridia bacterium]|nr:rRNA (guanine527-N7)-methyltransferase [Clostridia bacterium]